MEYVVHVLHILQLNGGLFGDIIIAFGDIIIAFGDKQKEAFFAIIIHFATKFDIVFDGIFDDIQKRGRFYPLFILFANDIYVCWKENE